MKHTVLREVAADADTLFWMNLPSIRERPNLERYWYYNDPDRYIEASGFLIPPLLRRVLNPTHPEKVEFMTEGHAGTLMALRDIATAIKTGTAKRGILLAVDSFIDPFAIEWLGAKGQLKSSKAPNGVMPGEGAVVLIMEARDEALRLGRPIIASVKAISVDRESYSYEEEEVIPDGTALTKTIRAILGSDRNNEPKVALCINDLNGEVIRAQEWGFAQQRLMSTFEGTELWPILSPALHFGELGAASAAFSICLAVRSMDRGYSLEDNVLVCGASRDGLRGSLLLGKN